MNRECDRVERWLADLGELAAPAADLAAHAETCPACCRRLEMERTLRERLGAGAELDPARRAALVAGILAPQTPTARSRRRILRWSWAGVAAAAAVLVIVLAIPKHRPPIQPTDVLGDLMGPLAVTALPAAPAAHSAPRENTEGGAPSASALPILNSAMAALWGDFEGPVSIGIGVMEAPRVAAAIPPTAEKKPTEINERGRVRPGN
jgi:hypothetical protein